MRVVKATRQLQVLECKFPSELQSPSLTSSPEQMLLEQVMNPLATQALKDGNDSPKVASPAQMTKADQIMGTSPVTKAELAQRLHRGDYDSFLELSVHPCKGLKAASAYLSMGLIYGSFYSPISSLPKVDLGVFSTPLDVACSWYGYIYEHEHALNNA